MCPTCGTPLDMSDAPAANRIKVFIVQRIAAGDTRRDRDKLVAHFGSGVARPSEGVRLSRGCCRSSARSGAAVVLGVCRLELEPRARARGASGDAARSGRRAADRRRARALRTDRRAGCGLRGRLRVGDHAVRAAAGAGLPRYCRRGRGAARAAWGRPSCGRHEPPLLRRLGRIFVLSVPERHRHGALLAGDPAARSMALCSSYSGWPCGAVSRAGAHRRGGAARRGAREWLPGVARRRRRPAPPRALARAGWLLVLAGGTSNRAAKGAALLPCTRSGWLAASCRRCVFREGDGDVPLGSRPLPAILASSGGPSLVALGLLLFFTGLVAARRARPLPAPVRVRGLGNSSDPVATIAAASSTRLRRAATSTSRWVGV